MSQQKQEVMHYLEIAFLEAKHNNDTTLMNSIARATVALNYTGSKKNPTLSDMLKQYQQDKKQSHIKPAV